ncbi:MAG TPA: hypothetical protein VEY11_20425 [Pyrinomonadaceae bacterium]|nr:hypothetical protein [Pyrinomonadaceae bacterium]
MATDATSALPDDIRESNANGGAKGATGQTSIPAVEEKSTLICERCDQESTRMSESREADDRVHHVCWTCLHRTEKRININRRWQRSRRV